MDKEDKVMNIAKRRGFIWGPSPNIYHGGVSGFYDWGPLGKLLKNKVESSIRKGLTAASFWEVESPSIMPRIVWEASGHYDSFIDPVVKDLKTNAIYRADHLIKEFFPKLKVEGLDFKELTKIIREKKLKSPDGNALSEVFPKNLMMQTTLGLDQEAYLRPETATTTYLLYPEYYNFFRTKFPLGVFQIGKAYRNEISPRQHVLRTREFTQAEAQLFILKEHENNFEKFKEFSNSKVPLQPYTKKSPQLISLNQALKKKIIKKQAYAFCIGLALKILTSMGFGKEQVRIRQHSKEELSHYADDAWDLEVKTKRFGWIEIVGVHDRQDYDLKRHSEFSKTKFPGKEIPSILEIAFGIERTTYALLESAFREDKIRSWLNFPTGMAPIDVAVFPLVKKDSLPKKAKEIFTLLDKDFVSIYDEAFIGRAYRRMDEVGCAACITIDYQTLKDSSVTLRDRDTMKQIRVKIKNLTETLNKFLSGEKLNKLGKIIN